MIKFNASRLANDIDKVFYVNGSIQITVDDNDLKGSVQPVYTPRGENPPYLVLSDESQTIYGFFFEKGLVYLIDKDGDVKKYEQNGDRWESVSDKLTLDDYKNLLEF